MSCDSVIELLVDDLILKYLLKYCSIQSFRQKGYCSIAAIREYDFESRDLYFYRSISTFKYSPNVLFHGMAMGQKLRPHPSNLQSTDHRVPLPVETRDGFFD